MLFPYLELPDDAFPALGCVAVLPFLPYLFVAYDLCGADDCVVFFVEDLPDEDFEDLSSTATYELLP